jgi:hypothetical protein
LIPSQKLTDIPPRSTVLDFVVFALALMGLRLVIMWVVNNTRGSVLMAILTHASWNTFYSASLIGLFPVRSVLGSYLNLTIAAARWRLCSSPSREAGWVTVRRPQERHAFAEAVARSCCGG